MSAPNTLGAGQKRAVLATHRATFRGRPFFSYGLKQSGGNTMLEFPYGKLSHKRIERLLRTGKLYYRLGGYSVRVVRRYTVEYKRAGQRTPCSYHSNIRNEESAVFSFELWIEHIKKQMKKERAAGTKKGQGGANPVHGSFADEQEEDTA